MSKSELKRPQDNKSSQDEPTCDHCRVSGKNPCNGFYFLVDFKLLSTPYVRRLRLPGGISLAELAKILKSVFQIPFAMDDGDWLLQFFIGHPNGQQSYKTKTNLGRQYLTDVYHRINSKPTQYTHLEYKVGPEDSNFTVQTTKFFEKHDGFTEVELLGGEGYDGQSLLNTMEEVDEEKIKSCIAEVRNVAAGCHPPQKDLALKNLGDRPLPPPRSRAIYREQKKKNRIEREKGRAASSLQDINEHINREVGERKLRNRTRSSEIIDLTGDSESETNKPKAFENPLGERNNPRVYKPSRIRRRSDGNGANRGFRMGSSEGSVRGSGQAHGSERSTGGNKKGTETKQKLHKPDAQESPKNWQGSRNPNALRQKTSPSAQGPTTPRTLPQQAAVRPDGGTNEIKTLNRNRRRRLSQEEDEENVVAPQKRRK